ncbi:MAG: MFS transporter [Pseudorhodoplanes sp.]|jgi:MFS family permease|nr:MFS transporter [Pseudorhodoplanes sp.]
MATKEKLATGGLSRESRVSIGFLNWAHAVDHYVMLIFPTVVIGLQVVYGRSYSELIALSTASFVAFGVFSLPAGWLADHWSRRNIMAVFFVGCGMSLIAAGMSPNVYILAVALAALGMFASIYHPVGMAMLIEASQARGRVLAFNGVCGNLGAALAAGITAVIATYFGWRMAFVVPAVLCIATGIFYLWMIPDDHHRTATRKTAPDVKLSKRAAAIMFGLFILIALGAGLAFNVISVALPKLIDERVGHDINLMAVGGLATAVFLVGAIAQLAMGRLVERIAPTILLTLVTATLFAGVFWSVYASGAMLIAALAVAMIGLYGQVTVNDVVIARYTADAWRGRVYAVRYFLVFISSGAAVAAIAYLHARGGFNLVLLATAGISFVFFAATVGVAILVAGVDGHKRAAVPAE